MSPPDNASLYERPGGVHAIAAVAEAPSSRGAGG